MTASYELASTFDLKPVYLSLALPPSAFTNPGAGRPAFSASINADRIDPGLVYLFKGADWYTFDPHSGGLERSPIPISRKWRLPADFDTGIDAATWGGPAFPDLWYFFKGGSYHKIHRAPGGIPHLRIRTPPVAKPMANGDWGAVDGTWLAASLDTALHGIRDHFGKIHFFRDTEYMRHDLFAGTIDLGPCPITEVFDLPDPFSRGIDFAFYGTGADSEIIHFLRGDQVALYDTESKRTLQVIAIDSRYPAFLEHVFRPQLFMVEQYTLNTYIGTPTGGRLVQALDIPARTRRTTLMVTETTETRAAKITQSLLESQDAAVVKDFYDELNTRNEQDKSSDTDRFNLDASFHGDASATSPWGGEVNASLNVKEGSDSLRQHFASSAFGTISSQVNATSRTLSQKVFGSSNEYVRTERTLRAEELVIDNTDSDDLLRYQYFQQMQPYLTLLVLKSSRLAAADGHGGLRFGALRDLDGILAANLSDPGMRKRVRDAVTTTGSAIEDWEGIDRAIVDVAADGVVGNARSTTSEYKITEPDGTRTTVSADGVIVAGRPWAASTQIMLAREA
ncbi:hypothetical protein [Actinomycetospora flava]|uniref:Uncharacterized protein n=1 Tax=Actinomycetospora flava TaxID=3129232 RepID=A0ABU8MFL4_9PSEU